MLLTTRQVQQTGEVALREDCIAAMQDCVHQAALLVVVMTVCILKRSPPHSVEAPTKRPEVQQQDPPHTGISAHAASRCVSCSRSHSHA